ncbi:MAG TPA: hypothetical protein VGI40_25795 [Pirellulaceae bacterium]
MRLYQHIKAEYFCTECKRGRTLIQPCISRLDWIVLACAGLPVAIVMLLRNESLSWWYCILAVYAGELLALYAAGFISSFIFLFDLRELREIHKCSECGGRMVLAGRHFDPAGDADPHYSDFVILGVFLLLNAAFWIIYARGGFGA